MTLEFVANFESPRRDFYHHYSGLAMSDDGEDGDDDADDEGDGDGNYSDGGGDDDGGDDG